MLTIWLRHATSPASRASADSGELFEIACRLRLAVDNTARHSQAPEKF